MLLAHEGSERHYTPEEYLELERRADSRSEFLDGVAYAMTDPPVDHQTICTNIVGVLYPQLRGTPCQAFVGHLKVRTPGKRLFAYPDLLVVCGGLQFHDEQSDVLTNPNVIVAVLSPSTQDYDMGTKRLRYQNMAPRHSPTPERAPACQR